MSLWVGWVVFLALAGLAYSRICDEVEGYLLDQQGSPLLILQQTWERQSKRKRTGKALFFSSFKMGTMSLKLKVAMKLHCKGHSFKEAWKVVAIVNFSHLRISPLCWSLLCVWREMKRMVERNREPKKREEEEKECVWVQSQEESGEFGKWEDLKQLQYGRQMGVRGNRVWYVFSWFENLIPFDIL